MASSQINIKWSATDIAIDIDEGESVGSLKRRIHEQTKVPPKRQKLLGLKAKGGKLAGDDVLIADLSIKPGQKIMLIG